MTNRRVSSCTPLSKYLKVRRTRGEERRKRETTRKIEERGDVGVMHAKVLPAEMFVGVRKCPQGRTAVFCRTQKCHTGDQLADTYTTRPLPVALCSHLALPFALSSFLSLRTPFHPFLGYLCAASAHRLIRMEAFLAVNLESKGWCQGSVQKFAWSEITRRYYVTIVGEKQLK